MEESPRDIATRNGLMIDLEDILGVGIRGGKIVHSAHTIHVKCLFWVLAICQQD